MSTVAVVNEISAGRPGKQILTWCPGCDNLHPFTVEAPENPDGERLNNGVTWEWDGNLESPTFSPSLLIPTSVHLCEHTYWACPEEDSGECTDTSHLLGFRLLDGTVIAPKVHLPVPDGAVRIKVHQSPCQDTIWGLCHSFLRNGQWQFLSDSAHHLAGQTVPMVPLPQGFLRE